MILRKRYYNEYPIEYEHNDDLSLLGHPELLQSPGSRSGISVLEHDTCASNRFLNEYQNKSKDSSYKEPPPYKPPPKVLVHAYQNQEKYGECVDEFKSALYAIGFQQNNTDLGTPVSEQEDVAPKLPPKLKSTNYSKQQIIDQTPEKSPCIANSDGKENVVEPSKTADIERTLDKQISVKEATKKFNRIASEEEANKIISPNTKKRPEKVCDLILFYCI